MTAITATQLAYEAARTQIVDHIDLDIQYGEIHALVGPNGAGKTTLLRLLAGDLTPSKGTVQIDGTNLSALTSKELARRRAVMPQSSTLGFGFTVAQVVEMGCHPHHQYNTTPHQTVRDALQEVGIPHLAHRTFRTLSGGEQALATLARILAQQAPILLLDEPTASLDLAHQEQVMHIAHTVANRGGAVLLVAHDLNLAAAHANRITLLHQGRNIATGQPWTVLTEPTLTATFGHQIAVTPNPHDNTPLITPRRTKGAPATSSTNHH